MQKRRTLITGSTVLKVVFGWCLQGTPDKLMTHLVEEHSSVDPTYVEDFLLTYRSFLKSPLEVADRLIAWFNSPKLRDKVTRVVLLWVNNHFNDFESETTMSEFLENFEGLLEREVRFGACILTMVLVYGVVHKGCMGLYMKGCVGLYIKGCMGLYTRGVWGCT